MELACKIAGSKLIVVIGHTKCGAIEAACNNIELGNLTSLLRKIKPAIETETKTFINRNGTNNSYLYNVTVNNVFLTVQKIKAQSSILKEMEEKNEIKIIGGLHDIETGQVTFF